MNIVFICADSLRRDHLGCYGNNWIHTPNLDRLGAESLTIDSHYAASFPTMPTRAESGRKLSPTIVRQETSWSCNLPIGKQSFALSGR